MNLQAKNHLSRSIIFLFAFLTTLGVKAGTVTSTFNSGDTLTATQMTEIKDAVNDNDTSITTHAANDSAHHLPVSVKQTPANVWLTLPDTAASVQSLTVTPPANGYLLVTANGSISFGYTTGSGGGFICVDLSDTEDYTGGCIPMAGSKSAYRSYIPDGFPTSTSGYGSSYSLSELFSASADTPVTFYISGYKSGIDFASLFHPTISVIFIPNSLQ